MNVLQEYDIGCPYCGESITILVDGSGGDQVYTEDCQVCCRPMVIRATGQAGSDFNVDARSEDDA